VHEQDDAHDVADTGDARVDPDEQRREDLIRFGEQDDIAAGDGVDDGDVLSR
jgi:hypothetical protein